jgi:hypothetical protein
MITMDLLVIPETGTCLVNSLHQYAPGELGFVFFFRPCTTLSFTLSISGVFHSFSCASERHLLSVVQSLCFT